MIYLVCFAAIYFSAGVLYVAALLLDPELTAEPARECFA